MSGCCQIDSVYPRLAASALCGLNWIGQPPRFSSNFCLHSRASILLLGLTHLLTLLDSHSALLALMSVIRMIKRIDPRGDIDQTLWPKIGGRSQIDPRYGM